MCARLDESRVTKSREGSVADVANSRPSNRLRIRVDWIFRYALRSIICALDVLIYVFVISFVCLIFLSLLCSKIMPTLRKVHAA